MQKYRIKKCRLKKAAPRLFSRILCRKSRRAPNKIFVARTKISSAPDFPSENPIYFRRFFRSNFLKKDWKRIRRAGFSKNCFKMHFYKGSKTNFMEGYLCKFPSLQPVNNAIKNSSFFHFPLNIPAEFLPLIFLRGISFHGPKTTKQSSVTSFHLESLQFSRPLFWLNTHVLPILCQKYMRATLLAWDVP